MESESLKVAGHGAEPRPPLSRMTKVAAMTIACNVLVGSIYVWFISLGTWSHWRISSTYYDQLATAFLHGQLSLETDPSPAVLALPDPYDYAARKGMNVPSDFSLYNGKFYLYFGPAPALMLAAIRPVFPGLIGDQNVAFAFTCAIFIFESLLVTRIWLRRFSDLPIWVLGISLLVLGLAGPWGLVLGAPRVHFAAVVGGQAFFLAGLFSAFLALDGARVANSGLLLAGIFWVGALATRATQLPAVAFMTVATIAGIVAKSRGQGVAISCVQTLQEMLPLVAPLGLGAVGLCWYNWARFGSIFESGFAYQMAAANVGKLQLWSPLFVVQNIYAYFLNPPRLKAAFPFLSSLHTSKDSIIGFIPLPRTYVPEEMTGLVISAPFILLALMSVPLLFRKAAPRALSHAEGQLPLAWVVTVLWGAFLFASAPILAFFWATARYFADFVPTLFVLSVIGFWQARQTLAQRPIGRALFGGLAIGLAVISIVLSTLLALSINSDAFRSLNPVLWRQLSNLFRP
jgi:hypothetical protein